MTGSTLPNAATNRRPSALSLSVLMVCGMGLTLYGGASIDQLQSMLHPTTAIIATALTVVLAALVIGVWLPNRFASQFVRFSRRKAVQRRDTSTEDASNDEAGARVPPSTEFVSDTQLRVMSSACLVCSALAMLAIEFTGGQFATFYTFMIEHYHWTPATLLVLDAIVVASYIAVPVILIGFAVNCSQRNLLFHSHHLQAGIASIIAGAAAALLFRILADQIPPASTTLVAAFALLLAGVAHMKPSNPCAMLPSDVLDLPALAQRWRRLLTVMNLIVGFLVCDYVMCWWQLEVSAAGTSSVWFGLGLLAVGLWISVYAYERALRLLDNLAVVYILTCLIISAVVIASGGGEWGVTRVRDATMLTLFKVSARALPCLLFGVVIGATTLACVERSSRAATSMLKSQLASGVGATLAAAAVIWPGRLTLTFEHFVIMILVWLTLGGLLLIHEPRFTLRHRLPHMALMAVALMSLCLILPGLVPQWSDQLALLHSSARIRFEAGIAPRAASEISWANSNSPAPNRREQQTWPALAGDINQEHAADRLLVRLLLAKEYYASARLQVPPDASQPLLRTLDAVVSRLSRLLKPDGVLTVEVASSASIEDTDIARRIATLATSGEFTVGQPTTSQIILRKSHPRIDAP